MVNLNRIKVVLVEQGKSGKWLAEQLKVYLHGKQMVHKYCAA